MYKAEKMCTYYACYARHIVEN